ncbi:MAG: uroporphyrinogen decarboxylase [Victivallaceae bacterium]
MKALKNRSQKTPIWFMRQVGRYLPEYQQLKKEHTLKELFHSEDFIAEATYLGPRILDTDAAILFSDILTVLDGFSLAYDFLPSSGPIIDYSLQELTFTNEPEIIFRPLIKGILSLKKELKVPLIGFAGSPFTIASYLIDGGASKDFKKTGIHMRRYPKEFSIMIDILIDATITYLKLQIQAGVDVIQLFDSCSHQLSEEDFLTYSVLPNQKIIRSLREKYDTPIILFCRNSSFYFRELIQTGADCLSIDWLTPLKKIRTGIPQHVALQGNMPPLLLCASQQEIQKYLDKHLLKNSNYIFNTGHGLVPETPVDNVKFTIDYIRNGF